MATLNFDPRWAEFLKTQGPGPQLTSPELGAFSGLVSDIQNPDSAKFRQYLGTGEYEKMFPELTQQRNANADWQRSLFDLFQKQYGTSAAASPIGPSAQIVAPESASIQSPAPPPISPPGEAPVVAPPAIFSAPTPTSAPAQANLSIAENQIPAPGELGAAAQNSALAKLPSFAGNWSDLFQTA